MIPEEIENEKQVTLFDDQNRVIEVDHEHDEDDETPQHADINSYPESPDHSKHRTSIKPVAAF